MEILPPSSHQDSMIVMTIAWTPFLRLESTPMRFLRNWECPLLKLRRYELKVQFKVKVMLSALRSLEGRANVLALPSSLD